MFIIIAGAFVVIAHLLRSIFWQIMSGLLAVAAGIEFISREPDDWTYLVFGTAIIAVGIYQWIATAIDLWKGD